MRVVYSAGKRPGDGRTASRGTHVAMPTVTTSAPNDAAVHHVLPVPRRKERSLQQDGHSQPRSVHGTQYSPQQHQGGEDELRE